MKVKYSVYQAALTCMVVRWLDGAVGVGAPTDKQARYDIAEVNDVVNANGTRTDRQRTEVDLDTETRRVYKEMVDIKVPGHLKVVTSHRMWLRITYEFLKKLGVTFSEKMVDLIRIHDLSKYTHREVLGYAVMFGDGSINWRHLETEFEKLEWDNTLYNHYVGNPHHPEYFYPEQEDGTRDKSVPMLKLDIENGQNFVDESILDMLAARGERSLARDPEFNVLKWLDIDEKYLTRYAEEDRLYVKKCLDTYRRLAEDFFSNEENVELLKGHFDNRHVIYKDYDI